MKGITNIAAATTVHAAQTSIRWQIGDARFHVWVDRETGELEPDAVLYKNPVAEKGQPGYFDRTRKLAAGALQNREMVEYVMSVVKRDGLVEKARQDAEAADAARMRQMEVEAAERAAKQIAASMTYLRKDYYSAMMDVLADNLDADDLDSLARRLQEKGAKS